MSEFVRRSGRRVGRGVQKAVDGILILSGHVARDCPDPRVICGQTSRRARKSIGSQLHEHIASVRGMRAPSNPARLLESVHEHRDGTGRERQPISELALSERPVGFQMLERVKVGGADTRRIRKSGAHAVTLETEALKLGGDHFGSGPRHDP
jgi:hypothetical protein